MDTIVPILYVKTGCPWCDDVIEFLEARRIAFTKVVVSGNREALEDLIDLSGQSKTPTMDWDGEVLADFGVEELTPFLRKKGIGA